MSSRLREEFLKLLREDAEFRYAVLGLLGIDEVLRRIDENTGAIKSLQEQVAEHSRIIKGLQEQVGVLVEQVARHGRILEEHSLAVRELASKIHALGTRWGL